ncbi:GSCOCG00010855001-RA-CDS, partial [Cotesia congregata]
YNDNNSSDVESEDEEPVNIEDESTLLMTQAIIFAPGEGQMPVSLFDKYTEALSFIKIYGGKLISQPKHLTYQNWIKSEIMRSYLKYMELNDNGFKFLSHDRGSPSFWKEKKKNVFALFRQLGPPSIFFTLSAAETKWPELIVMLKKVIDKEEISLIEAEKMDYKEKARLISNDPVTIARYFDYRIRELFKVMKEKNSIFREHVIMDFYYRIEFQQRGSLHIHSVYYILALPLSMCSREVVFVNTNHPENRIQIVKSKQELQKLPSNSTDIYIKDTLDHYVNRPYELENIYLASFVAWYNYSSKDYPKKNETYNDKDYDDDDDDLINNNLSLKLIDSFGFVRKRNKSKILRFINYDEQKDKENFIRENVMLFIPWRNENILRTSSCELFSENLDLIKERRTEYIYIYNENVEIVLKEAMQKIINESDDENETNGYTPKNLEVFNDPSQAENFINLIGFLNEKQRIFLLHILHCFKIKSLPLYHCVIGGAGVGKSRLIEAIYQCLLRLLNFNSDNLESIKILLCAPTGKAAFGIKGTTLHAAFILPYNQCSTELTPLIDSRLKQIFQTSKPFGGVSVIVFGDFNQLAPVGDRYVFEAHTTDLYGDIIGNPLWNLFTSYELTEIMRQKNDVKFAKALNNLASGTLTKNDMSLFESRIVKANNDIPEGAIYLFRTNDEVDCFNINIINKDIHKKNIIANDKIKGKTSKIMEQNLLNLCKTIETKNAQGLPSNLLLSISIKYMVTVNIDVEDGLVNGAVGILQGYELNNKREISRLWLDFSDDQIGKKRRKEIPKEDHKNWTAIDKIMKNIQPTKKIVTIIREQFPLVPAEAITIHKSQGGTYNTVVIHLVKGMKKNELYVAFSRCTKLNGLFIVGNLKIPSHQNPYDKVHIEVERL